MNSWNVFALHWANSWDASFSWELLQFKVASHVRVGRHLRKADINKLLGVETSMPVGGISNGGRDSHSGSVNGLPNVAQIDTTRNFLDENGCESLSTKVFVNAQEIDFSFHDFLAVNAHMNWNS